MLGSQAAGDTPGGRLPLISARPAVTFPAKEITCPPWPIANYTAWQQRPCNGAQPSLEPATCESALPIAQPRHLRPIYLTTASY